MKKQFKVILVSSLFSVPFFSSGTNLITHLLDEEPSKYDRNKGIPELPATEDGITCEYDGSYLMINFEKGEGMASMVLSCVSDGCEMASVNFQASSQFVYYIGEITEPIKVEITTNAGSYYCEVIQ